MKTQLTLALLSISTFSCLQASSVANWKVMFNGPPSATTGLNTDSPVFGDAGVTNDVETVGFAGLFGTTASPASVTIAQGQTLTVSATINLTGGALWRIPSLPNRRV